MLEIRTITSPLRKINASSTIPRAVSDGGKQWLGRGGGVVSAVGGYNRRSSTYIAIHPASVQQCD